MRRRRIPWTVLVAGAVLAAASCSGSAGGDGGAAGGTSIPERVEQPVDCDAAEAGSPTDLASEPTEWLQYNDYLRWQDEAGCNVRVDVISNSMGPDHCGWTKAEWLTIGDPVGTSVGQEQISEDARTYIWDPEGDLGVDDGIDRATTLPVDELPETAAATGYQRDGGELWLDPKDPDHAYRVRDGEAQRFALDPDHRMLCA